MMTVGLLAAAMISPVHGDQGQRLARAEMEEGVRAAKRGYWLEALSRFEQARLHDPGDARVLNNLAVALEAVGRYEEAKETYEAAYTGNTGDRGLRRNYQRFQEFYDKHVLKKQPEEGGEGEEDDG
jgi:Flp pilus assembly protein TadD